mgnify:FL=1
MPEQELGDTEDHEHNAKHQNSQGYNKFGSINKWFLKIIDLKSMSDSIRGIFQGKTDLNFIILKIQWIIYL